MCPKMNQKLVVIIVSLCLCLTGLIGIAVAIAVGFKSADAPTTPSAESKKADVSFDLVKESKILGEDIVDVLYEIFVPETTVIGPKSADASQSLKSSTAAVTSTTEASTTTAKPDQSVDGINLDVIDTLEDGFIDFVSDYLP